MSLQLVYSAVRGEFDQAIRQIYSPIAIAATGAIKDAGDQIKSSGRANIAAAGFSRKWQNALRVNLYPPRGASADAALLAFHKIPYAGVFETGATIHGKPLLWIPVSGAPARIGGRKLTPQSFNQLIGPLVSLRSRRGTPILAGQISGKSGGKITLAKLRRGRRGEGGRTGTRLQPIFVGIRAAHLRQRFQLQSVFKKAADGLGAGYLKHLKA